MSSSPRAPIPTPSPTAPRHGTDPSRPRRRARHRLRGLAPARRGAMRVTVAVGFAAAPRSSLPLRLRPRSAPLPTPTAPRPSSVRAAAACSPPSLWPCSHATQRRTKPAGARPWVSTGAR
uniref:Uncharacterized protein n=1 Tax=Oryza nivara TaxID=4536 RepID=A0A0E0HH54_ORYNI